MENINLYTKMNRDRTFDSNTDIIEELDRKRIVVEKEKATVESPDLKFSDETLEVVNSSKAGIQAESSSPLQEQILCTTQNTDTLSDMVDIHGQRSNNVIDNNKECEADVDVLAESTDDEIKLLPESDQLKEDNTQCAIQYLSEEKKTNGLGKQKWKPFDFCMKKSIISKEELSKVVQTLLLDYVLMLILQSVFTNEPLKKMNETTQWLFTFDFDVFLDITLCAIPYIPGATGIHIWDNTESVRKILRDAMLRRIWLETEPFRLATFSLLQGWLPQVNILHLARTGFFCDINGQIHCHHCNRSYTTENAESEAHHLDCRAYETTTETIADYGAHASDNIVPSSYGHQCNLWTNFRLGQTRSFMQTGEDTQGETEQTISLRSQGNCVQETDRSASTNFPDPNIPHQYPEMESTHATHRNNQYRRRRNRIIWDRRDMNISDVAPTSSLLREMLQNTTFASVHQTANHAPTLVPNERNYAACLPPILDPITRRIPNYTASSPDRFFYLNTRHNDTGPCTRNNALQPKLQGSDYRNEILSTKTSTYGEAATTNQCMTNVNSHVRYQENTGNANSKRRNTTQSEQQSNDMSSKQSAESMTQATEKTKPERENIPGYDDGISKKTLKKTAQHSRGSDLTDERSQSLSNAGDQNMSNFGTARYETGHYLRTDISAGAAEPQTDNLPPGANQNGNPYKCDEDDSALVVVAQQMSDNENLQACLTQPTAQCSQLSGINRQQRTLDKSSDNDSNSAQSEKDITKTRNKISGVKAGKQKASSTKADVVVGKEGKMTAGSPKVKHNCRPRKVITGRESPTKGREFFSSQNLQAEPSQVIKPERIETETSFVNPKTPTIINNPQTIRDSNTSNTMSGVYFLLHPQQSSSNGNTNVSLRKKTEASSTNGNMLEDRNRDSGAHPDSSDTSQNTRCYKCRYKYETQSDVPAKCCTQCCKLFPIFETRGGGLTENRNLTTAETLAVDCPTGAAAAVGVRVPEMADLDLRIESFNLDKNKFTQTPQALAMAGLFCLRESDVVQCHVCGGCMKQWQKFDVPLLEHIRNFPVCEFVWNIVIDMQMCDDPMMQKVLEAFADSEGGVQAQRDGYTREQVCTAAYKLIFNREKVTYSNIVSKLQEMNL